MKVFPLSCADFYKVGHIFQYPKGTTKVYSNMTPRMSRNTYTNEVVFFGLQYFMREYLVRNWNDEFFFKPKAKVIRKYKRRLDYALGADSVTVNHIEALHDLGYLPIKIKAVYEGAVVPMRTPVLTVVNTHPDFFWLTNYIETLLSCMIWKPCTSATTAFHYRKEFERHMQKTGGPKDFVKWQGHDFSFRGMSGLEDACLSGSAHLLSFTGTDTIPAIDFLEEYYNADANTELIAGSVPATEHAVMCVGMKDNEIETFERLICEVYPNGVVSIVSDTWDFWQVMTEYLPLLKDKILARNGRLVIRPDSGDPVHIVAGYRISERPDDDTNAEVLLKDGKYFLLEKVYVSGEWKWKIGQELSEAEAIGAYAYMWKIFGGTISNTGYKILDSHIGLIYGDSITLDRQRNILSRLEEAGFSASNLVLGIGSFTYEYVTRDVYGFAMKATYAEVNGESREIFKDPKTDSGMKKSARGLIRVNSDFSYTDQVTWYEESTGMLKTVFENGKIVKEFSLSEIRARIDSHFQNIAYDSNSTMIVNS